MGTISINVADCAAYKNYDEVLEHIHQKHLADGIVRDTYLQALREREADYPTGILLDGYAVAIHIAIASTPSARRFTSSVYLRKLKLIRQMVTRNCGFAWLLTWLLLNQQINCSC